MYTGRALLILINFIFGLIELILGLRIVFELFGASSSAPFVNWLYEISRTVLYPFRGMFPSPVLKGGFVLDMSAIVALLIYSLIAYFMSELIHYISFHAHNYSDDKRR